MDPQLAIKLFTAPPSFKIDLFAAEPQLMNPVSFCLDEHGRVFVAETFRYRTSAFDIRQHMKMYYEDLASRTVEDRAAMIRRFLGNRVGEMSVQSEVVRLLEDRGGTGRADFSADFADGFNSSWTASAPACWQGKERSITPILPTFGCCKTRRARAKRIIAPR